MKIRVPKEYWDTGRFFHEYEEAHIEMFYNDTVEEEFPPELSTIGFFHTLGGRILSRKPYADLPSRLKSKVRKWYRQGYWSEIEEAVYECD